MKKISTYLFLLVAFANVGVGLLIRHTARFMSQTYQDMLEGMPLPALSEQVLSVPWWPYIFVAAGVLGAVISVTTRTRSGMLSHTLCIILLLEVVGLALTTFGLCLPMNIPTLKLLP